MTATATEATKSAATATVLEIASTMPQSEKRRVMAAMAVLTGESTPRFMVEIVRDDTPMNPREWDNLGTMACWHDRYDLGDKHDFKEPYDFMRDLVDDCVSTSELVDYVAEGKAEGLKFENGEEPATSVLMSYWDSGKCWGEEYAFSLPYNDGDYQMRERILDCLQDHDLRKIAELHNVIMPLYLYDHSGISMSTGTFVGRAQHAQWDSGQVGWTYVSHKRVAEEYGDSSPESIEKAQDCLKCEVESYDCYLRGSCYGFRLYEYGSEIDSCYGFLGSFDDAKKAIADYLPTAAALAIQNLNFSNTSAEYDENEDENDSENEAEGEFGDGELDDERGDEDDEDDDELEGEF